MMVRSPLHAQDSLLTDMTRHTAASCGPTWLSQPTRISNLMLRSTPRTRTPSSPTSPRPSASASRLLSLLLPQSVADNLCARTGSSTSAFPRHSCPSRCLSRSSRTRLRLPLRPPRRISPRSAACLFVRSKGVHQQVVSVLFRWLSDLSTKRSRRRRQLFRRWGKGSFVRFVPHAILEGSRVYAGLPCAHGDPCAVPPPTSFCASKKLHDLLGEPLARGSCSVEELLLAIVSTLRGLPDLTGAHLARRPGAWRPDATRMRSRHRT